jgi:hypothetical protein
MEILEKFIFVVVAIVYMIVLVSLAWNILKIPNSNEKIKFEGDNSSVIKGVANLIYRCFDDNQQEKSSVICFEADFKSSQNISSSDLLSSLSPSRIKKENVVAEDLGDSGKIIIRYEDQFVYVKKVEIEGSSY